MDKRPHIVCSAQLLFAQFGLKRVTMDDIAREAQHVSKATLYKYFKNKEDIFDTVINKEINSLFTVIKESIDAREGIREKLKAHLTTRLGRISEFVNFHRVTQDSWGDYWPHIARIRTDFITKEHSIVADLLKRGISLGELEVKDPDRLAWALVLALASTEYQWALRDGIFSLSELVDTMISMMFKGIGGQRS